MPSRQGSGSREQTGPGPCQVYIQGIAQWKDDNPIGRPGDLTALTFRGSFCGGEGLPGGGGPPEGFASVSWGTIVPAEEITLLKVLTSPSPL